MISQYECYEIIAAAINSANHTTGRFQNCFRRTILWQLHVLSSLLSVLSFFGMFASSTSMSFLTKEGCETVLLQSSPLAFCRHSFVMQISPLVFQVDLPYASRSWCPWVANESVFRTASAGQSFGSFMFFCRCFLFSLFSACSLAPPRCHS